MAKQLMTNSFGLFEITDHTTASDWERFIANLEDILIDWKLTKQSHKDHNHRELRPGSISKGIWHERREVLRLGNVSFDLRYQYLSESDRESTQEEKSIIQDDGGTNENNRCSLDEFHDATNEISSEGDDTIYSEDEEIDQDEKTSSTNKKAIPLEQEREHEEHELPEKMPECLIDLITTGNDFASKAHCLVRWYNLRRFIILTPKADTIISEDRVKLVLSSASIALSNTDCHVPIFLQIRNPRNNFYQGISEHLNIRTMYEMIFLKRGIKQYSYLSELISLFREKTGCNLNDPINATIRLNYCLDSFELFVEPHEEFTGDEYNLDEDLNKQTTTTTATTPTTSRLSKLRPQDMRSGATFEQVKEALEDCLPHPYKILKFIHIAALWPPVSDKVITDSQIHSDLDPAEAPTWTIRIITSDNCNMKIVHETQALYNLLSSAIDHAYDKLDADMAFDDCDRVSLKAKCLKLSYDLSLEPEVILSDKPTDGIRKLIALLFFKAAEIKSSDSDALTQIAGQLRKTPSLSEIYRNFAKQNRTSVKEFIIRSQISRPFNPISTPALPQRMFCTICDEEFRLCGAFSELCN